MFGLGGTPSLPSAGEVLGFLLLIAVVVFAVRRSALFADRATLEKDRERAFKLGVGMVVGWIVFLLVLFVVATVKLLPLLFEQ